MNPRPWLARSLRAPAVQLGRPGGVALATAVVSLFAVTGCQVASRTSPATRSAESVAYLTIDEFTAALDGDDEVLLVEFCVPVGCFRCDQMRGPIDRLAEAGREGLTVRRVNLSQQPELAWEFGVTVCPSYVAFRGGEEIYRAAFPTSADLILSGLEESLKEPAADRLALAAN